VSLSRPQRHKIACRIRCVRGLKMPHTAGLGLCFMGLRICLESCTALLPFGVSLAILA